MVKIINRRQKSARQYRLVPKYNIFGHR